MNTLYNAREHLKLIALDIEMTLRHIKPYNGLREMNDDGLLMMEQKDGSYKAISFKPFWEVSQ